LTAASRASIALAVRGVSRQKYSSFVSIRTILVRRLSRARVLQPVETARGPGSEVEGREKDAFHGDRSGKQGIGSGGAAR
jgi:hypothetical protein